MGHHRLQLENLHWRASAASSIAIASSGHGRAPLRTSFLHCRKNWYLWKYEMLTNLVGSKDGVHVGTNKAVGFAWLSWPWWIWKYKTTIDTDWHPNNLFSWKGGEDPQSENHRPRSHKCQAIVKINDSIYILPPKQTVHTELILLWAWKVLSGKTWLLVSVCMEDQLQRKDEYMI